MNGDRVLGRPLDDRDAFRNLIEALKLAESATRQLALTRDNPNWLTVGVALAQCRDTCVALATRGR